MPRAIFYVGMDVHKDSVTLAVFGRTGREPRTLQRLPNDAAKLRRLLDRLAREGDVRCCYEASGAGFVLQRQVTAWGYRCEMVAPSLIPSRPGDHRKHDRRDAIELGRLYRAGELVLIHIPDEREEQVRDLVRCREVFQREIIKSRHYVSSFLRRRGYIYRDGTPWTRRHLEWLRRIQNGADLSAEDRCTLTEYLALLEYKLDRRTELDQRIEALALTPLYRSRVQRLCCFRGISAHAAMVLVTEIGDFRRFVNPRQLMAYLGLVPREHSSGDRRQLGAITKAGNSHCRHVLVQAAWHYRNRPALSAPLRARQRGQPADVIAHAWKAQHRLHKLYHRVAFKRPSQVAVVAAARELVGFVWAVLQAEELSSTERAA